ncbi:MAG: glycosyltransferase [Firmicutes bacterium]|nr:glycosyltransferase [Bacillota bacterium]
MSNKIKILHVLTDSNVGGAGHQLLALLDKHTGVNRQKFEPIIALPQNAKLTPIFQSHDITCIELPHLAESSFSLKAVGVLLKEIKKLQPHIIHTHASLSGRLAARRYKKCKIVYTRHSVFEPATWQKIFPMRNIFGWINNYFSDAIIAVSPAAKDNLLALGTSAKNIHVIFNGTAPAKEYSDEEREQLRAKFSIPQDAFILAQIARLTEVKGQDDVLDAAKNLPDAFVLIAGDGERRTHLEARIKNEGITNVRLLGFVTEVDELLAVMDVQLSASFGTEATSMALIQGMSVGKPAIVTDYGGNPYVISNGENGIIIPIRNPSALTEAVNKLQTDHAFYAAISAKARQIYTKRFTVQEMVTKTEQLYTDLI